MPFVSVNMTAVVILLLLFACVVGYVEISRYGQSFQLQCPIGQSIKQLVSSYSYPHRDRRYMVVCRNSSVTPFCGWYGNANRLHESLSFQCPGHSGISGIKSVYNSSLKDSRFDFYCCSLKDKSIVSCSTSSFVNNWGTTFRYSVPSEQILRGVFSYHNNYRIDRRWKFISCQVQ